MIDLQNSKSNINISINKVGVKDASHPIVFATSGREKQSTIANFNMYVDLKENQRGTHMSRFIEILNQKQWELSIPGLQELLTIHPIQLIEPFKTTNVADIRAMSTIVLVKNVNNQI